MDIASLGYIGIRSTKQDDWASYATGLLGMQRVDRAGKVQAYRMDDRAQRLVITDDDAEGLDFIGWQATDTAALERLAARLSDHGHAVAEGHRDLCDQRHVGRLIQFQDPEGNRVEVFTDPHLETDPFVPGRPISGFKTGPYGMGHAVLKVKNAENLLGFYRDILGFQVSDYGQKPYPLYFFHVNGRHHSFAMVGTGGRGFHHFMVEYDSLDDVGQGYDLAQLDDGRIAYTLGRHTNDFMTSFYSHTPSGFFIESGFGGRIIDPLTWQPHETFCGPSFWGHDRPFMPDDLRQEFSDMRLELARQGQRAPNCPWLDATDRKPAN
jgi:2,3-dihydroxybiphenyl 1,2-dioxygenase